MLKKQFDDMAKKIQAAAVSGAQQAPFGSDVALAAVKQAIDAGNAAYADLSKKVTGINSLLHSGQSNV